jgi:hypothetical protein
MMNKLTLMQRPNMSAILLNTCRNQLKLTTELAFYSIRTCIPLVTAKVHMALQGGLQIS